MKDIKGYEGRYAVTEDGQIYSYYSKNFIYQQLNHGGYLMVRLRKNGEQRRYSVHRLVAETFIENPNNLPEVNHKDENKLNNSVENLEWCDRVYNINYGTAHERACLTQQKTSPNKKAVMCIETGIVYFSCMEAKRQTGIHNTSISAVCNGRKKTAGGYHWKFV